MHLRDDSCDGADHCGHDVGVLPESGCADPAERGDLPAPTLECVLKRESSDGGRGGAPPWSLSNVQALTERRGGVEAEKAAGLTNMAKAPSEKTLDELAQDMHTRGPDAPHGEGGDGVASD